MPGGGHFVSRQGTYHVPSNMQGTGFEAKTSNDLGLEKRAGQLAGTRRIVGKGMESIHQKVRAVSGGQEKPKRK